MAEISSSSTMAAAHTEFALGPSWAADWPPYSSKHRQRLSRPQMPDRKHSAGMLDEEEDTRDIDLEKLKRSDLTRLLRDLRDDFARLKLLQTAFSYRVGDEVETLQMKGSDAQSRYEESNTLRLATEKNIRKASKLALKQKQAGAFAGVAPGAFSAKKGVGTDTLFSLDLKENSAFRKYASVVPSRVGGERKFCYSCGSKLKNSMEQFDERCADCVAEADGLAEMNSALQKISLRKTSPKPVEEEMEFASVFPEPDSLLPSPNIIVCTSEDKDDEIEMELDDGSEYASTTASTLSDTAASEEPSSVPASLDESDVVEPMIVGSVPPEDDEYIQESVAVEGVKGAAGDNKDESVQSYY